MITEEEKVRMTQRRKEQDERCKRILQAIRKMNPIELGDTRWTDYIIYDDDCITLKAVAQVHFIAIDNDTGEKIDSKCIPLTFAVQVAHDSDEMHFVEMDIE